MFEFLKNVVKTRLSPFKHKNFRQFFFVQSLSLVGTWSHDLARSWIVIELMGKASALGSLQIAAALPSFIFLLIGGVVADRSNVRQLMMITKFLLALSALALASLVEFGSVTMWMLILFSIFEGAVSGFDMPAYQALTPRLVPREDFQQAIAINSLNFHTGRMFGPLLAGVLLSVYGPSLVFLVDAMTYLLLIAILSRLVLNNPYRDLSKIESNQLKAIKDGFIYAWRDSHMRYPLLQLLITILLVLPLSLVVFRNFIPLKFNLSGKEFGFVFTFFPMGAMVGALTFTLWKPQKPLQALVAGIPFMTLFIFLIPITNNLILTTAFMCISGFFGYLSFASLTVTLHLNVVEEYRGRIGSMIGICFLSLGPLAGYPIGVYADKVGFVNSVQSLIIVFAVLSAWLAIQHYRQKKRLKS